MATVFWDKDGIILIDFLEGQRTITASYNEGVLRKLKTALVKKRKGKLHRQILFHHDNAPAHTAKSVKAVLQEFRSEVLSHPPYSPDLAPSDFFLFPKLKEYLKGRRFQSIDVAKKEAITWLTKQFPQFYQDGIFRWKHRLQKCYELDENYVEK